MTHKKRTPRFHSTVCHTVPTPEPPSDPIGDALRADAVAYWKFDDNTLDSTSNDNDLTLTNGDVAYVSGKVNNAIDFSLPDTGVVLNNSFSVFNMGGRSFSFWGWIKPHAAEGTLWQKGDHDDSNEYSLEFDGLGNVVFKVVQDDYLSVDVTALSFTPILDEWFFYAVYCDLIGNEIGIQINGGTIHTETFDGDVLNGSTPFVVGSAYFSFGPSYSIRCDAGQDETGMLYRKLTSDERTYLYNAGAGRTLFP